MNGFDFYFDLFWMAWHWKPAIVSWLAVFHYFRVSSISVLSAEKNENWPQIFHFCFFHKKWQLNTDFHFFKFHFLKQQNLQKYENWKSIVNFYFVFLKLKKKKIEHRLSIFHFQLWEKMNDPNIHVLSETQNGLIFILKFANIA